jgi:hypothetical protein
MRFNSHNRDFSLKRLIWNRLQWVWIATAFIWLCAVVPGFAEDMNYMNPSYDNLFSDYKLGSKPNDSFSIYKESYGSAGPMVLNYQSGLLEQVVLVVNNTTTNWSAVKLLVSNVKGGIVYNASVVSHDQYELIHNYTVAANGGMVKFVVEYKLDSSNESEELEEEPHFAFQPIQAGKPVLSSESMRPVRTIMEIQPLGVGYYSVDLPTKMNTPQDWSQPLSPYGMGGWSNVGVVLSFDAVEGKIYEIQYSEDGVHWLPSVPRVKAAGNLVFWVDKGSPKTPSHPMLTIVPGGIPAPLRLYRVMEIQ